MRFVLVEFICFLFALWFRLIYLMSLTSLTIADNRVGPTTIGLHQRRVLGRVLFGILIQFMPQPRVVLYECVERVGFCHSCAHKH
jgi:hypothetical protein